MNIEEAKKYLAEGHFKVGSMKPKVEAGIRFIEKGGDRSVIGSLFSAVAALEGRDGTTITK